jgi:hypothetical protein
MPGWAWVGERGPELINLHGGETVLDAQTSKSITGYAGGAMSKETQAVLALLSRIAGITLQTPNKSLEATRNRLLTLVGEHFSGPAETKRESMLARQVMIMEQVRDHLHSLNARIARERGYQRSVFQSLSGTGALSGLSLGPTAGVGDNVALSGGQGLKIQLSTKLSTLKKFAAALKKLHHLKLPASLFREIVAMGPDSGLAMADELISGGPAFIRQLSGLESQLTAEEKRISQGAASTVYEGHYRTGRSFTRGLEQERAHLERLFRGLGRALGQEAVRWFHVPNSKVPGRFRLRGIHHHPMLSNFELSTPQSSGMDSGGNVYITVNASGLVDPDHMAMEIQKALLKRKRIHGNMALGLA